MPTPSSPEAQPATQRLPFLSHDDNGYPLWQTWEAQPEPGPDSSGTTCGNGTHLDPGALGAIFDPAIEAWVVRVSDSWVVAVVPMLFNHRITITALDEYPRTYTAGWCYPDAATAYLAALDYRPDDQPPRPGFNEPVGFLKRAGDNS